MFNSFQLWAAAFALIGLGADSSDLASARRCGPGPVAPAVEGQLVVSAEGALRFDLRAAGSVEQGTVALQLGNRGDKELEFRLIPNQTWIRTGVDRGHLAPSDEVEIAVGISLDQLPPLGRAQLTGSVLIENRSGGFGSVVLQVEVLRHSIGRAAKPGPHNTGPTTPDDLTPIESIVVSEPGRVIEGVDVHGQIVIAADDVTIRNFRVDAGGALYGITTGHGEYSGTVLEDGEIANAQSAGVFGAGFVARRLEIHEIGSDGIKARGDAVVEASWIHHLGLNPGTHADGNQTRSGRRLVFRGNNIDMPGAGSPNEIPGYLSNATLLFQDELGPVDDVLVEGNWLNGGNYTVMIRQGGNGGISNVRIVDNRFGRDSQFGPLSLEGDGFVVKGNVWDDTSEPLVLAGRPW